MSYVFHTGTCIWTRVIVQVKAQPVVMNRSFFIYSLFIINLLSISLSRIIPLFKLINMAIECYNCKKQRPQPIFAKRVFSLYAHIRILPLHGEHAGVLQHSGQLEKSTFAVAMGQRRQLTVQVLHITTQIPTSLVYANLVHVALCVAP